MPLSAISLSRTQYQNHVITPPLYPDIAPRLRSCVCPTKHLPSCCARPSTLQRDPASDAQKLLHPRAHAACLGNVEATARVDCDGVHQHELAGGERSARVL